MKPTNAPTTINGDEYYRVAGFAELVGCSEQWIRNCLADNDNGHDLTEFTIYRFDRPLIRFDAAKLFPTYLKRNQEDS